MIPRSPSSSTSRTTHANKAYVASLGAYITDLPVGCDGSDYLINGNPVTGDATTPTPLTWTAVELNSGGAASSTSTIQFNNKTGLDGVNQDACKGATLTLNYVAK